MPRQGLIRSLGGGQRRNPLSRRGTPDEGGSNSDRGDGSGSVCSNGRSRELDEQGDMRMRALERSWAQGLPNSGSTSMP